MAYLKSKHHEAMLEPSAKHSKIKQIRSTHLFSQKGKTFVNLDRNHAVMGELNKQTRVKWRLWHPIAKFENSTTVT